MQRSHRVVSFGVAVPAVQGKRTAPMGIRLSQKDRERWKGSTLACLRYLARNADEKTGIVRGKGLKEIAGWLQLSWQRTRAIMQTLRESGVVETIRRGGGKQKNVYRLHLSRSGTA